jgi:hypothetical protein
LAEGAKERAKRKGGASSDAKGDEPAGGTPEWTSSSGFDPREWMKAHQVTGQVGREANCESAQIGAPPVDAMSCDERSEVQLVRGPVQSGPEQPPEVIPPVVMFRRVLYVPAGGGLRKALDIPIEAGPMNPVTKDPDANAFARLHVELNAEGTRLTVADDPSFSCDRARAKQAELAADKDTAETAKWLKKAVDPVCASRGDYAWRAGSFQRTKGKK